MRSKPGRSWRWPVTEPDLLGLFVAPLDRLNVRYMVTGGVAAVVYGDPRFTRDVDLVLELEAAQVGPFVAAFDGGDFYVPPEEAVVQEVGRREGGHFNVIHRDTALRADIYLAAGELHRWALERRRRIDVADGLSIWLAPPEYVIVRKLEYLRASGSDRHLRDVAMMLRISGPLIDESAVDDWSERRGVVDLLEQARRFGPA